MSPQISSLIAQGKSPCTSTHTTPSGCSLDARSWTTGFCLNPSSCGTRDFDLAAVFAPVAIDTSIDITDTVSYCPVDADGNAVGSCAGTLADQCDESHVTTVYVNSFTPPEQPASASVLVSSASCEFKAGDAYVSHYDVHMAGTASGPEGAWLFALSNPIFAESFIMTCGSWTLDDTTHWGCYRASGQAETTAFTHAFDVLWVDTGTSREVSVKAQVQYDADDPGDPYGDILAQHGAQVVCGP